MLNAALVTTWGKFMNADVAASLIDTSGLERNESRVSIMSCCPSQYIPNARAVTDLVRLEDPKRA
jgi:hypothetical protein